MSHSFIALSLPAIPEIVFILLITALLGVVTVLPFWFILKRAGFHPALSILTIIPIANIIVLFFLAFSPWPAFEKRDTKKS